VSAWAQSLNQKIPIQPAHMFETLLAAMLADIAILFFLSVMVRGWPKFRDK